MKRTLFPIVILIFTIILPLHAQQKYTSETNIDWETGNFLRATGYATYPVEEAVNIVQAKLMAKRGAEVDARSQLARTLEGVKIAGGTTLEKMVATNDKVAEAFNSFLEGVVVVSSEVTMDQGAPLGIAVVEKGLTGREGFLGKVYNASPSMLDDEPYPSSPEKIVKEMGKYDGLIIDARTLSVKPDFNILVKSQQGTVAYSRNSLDTDVRLNDLTARFCKSELRAKELLVEKGASNPLMITPNSIQNGREFIVSSEDAVKILSLHEESDALKKARVIILTG
jgi:hypothetical protein